MWNKVKSAQLNNLGSYYRGWIAIGGRADDQRGNYDDALSCFLEYNKNVIWQGHNRILYG